MSELIERMLIVDEGVRLRPYVDSVGKLTIGIGRNLDDVGLRLDEALYLLRNDITVAYQNAVRIFGAEFMLRLDDVRQAVIVDMLFNLGYKRFLGFKKFIGAVKRKEWDKAAEEMLNSLWAKQVGKRAERLAYMMRTGKVHQEYLNGKEVDNGRAN